MGTKRNPGDYDCYASAEDDEPIFILLGRDKDASTIVRFWAACRESLIEQGIKPPEDMKQVNEARQCAYEMDRWRNMKKMLISTDEYNASDNNSTKSMGTQ